MKYALDSSSVINLLNAGALELATRVDRCEICLPPLVVGECGLSSAAELIELRDAGRLSFVNDEDVDAELFADLLNTHGLGAGETECLAVAMTKRLSVCCDDRKARELAAELLGPARVAGTLRILRWTVEDALISCDGAYSLFNLMRQKGGFLPETEQAFFCKGG